MRIIYTITYVVKKTKGVIIVKIMHNKFVLYYFINNSMKKVRLSLSISTCVYICTYVEHLNINLTFTLFQVF